MALIPHYFHYTQFNLLVNKLKSRQVVFTISIAIIFTVAGVKYVCVKQFVQLLQYSQVFSTAVHYSRVQLY